VKEDLLPDLHGHQAKALARLSLGMALARHCSSALVSVAVPATRAKPASVRRQQERLLANPRLRAGWAMNQMARHLLERWTAPAELLLILDETPKANDLRLLKLGIAFHKREIPLIGICYRNGETPDTMPKLVAKLLRRVGRMLRGRHDLNVTLLADRGLCWPLVLDLCEQMGWHYVLRAQVGTRLRLEERTIRSLGELTRRGGEPWCGSGEVFKKSGWRQANVVCCWPADSAEPWLLITDRPASLRRCQNYCKRTWCEESHRDQKSSGLQWQQSKVNDPTHAARLILLMALAMLLAIALGCQVIKRGWRKDLDPHRHRRLSIFQLGDRWLICSMHRQLDVPLHISLPP